MNEKRYASMLKRAACLLLAFVMVLGMLPGPIHAHAAEQPEFELIFYRGKARENGFHINFKTTAVDNPAGGEKVTLGVNVLSGEAGTSWVGVFEGLHDLETDYSKMETILTRNIADIDGATPFSMNWPSKGGFTFEMGDYSIVIFLDETTDHPVKYVTFTVYRNILSETVVQEPTCTEPGMKHVVYEDDNVASTPEEVDIEIPAMGHDWNAWTYNSDIAKHQHTCQRSGCGVTEAEDCTYGEDDLCVKCGAAYIRVEIGREYVAPTCEEEGYTLISYADGSTARIDPVPALGHDYTWTRVEGTGTHKGVCANDADHVTIGDCEYENDVCTVCGGALVILYTDKTEYAYGDPILVNAIGEGKDWVGIYKKGETYNPSANGSYSIFWYYIADESQKNVNILDTRDENGRGAEFIAGEYTIVLFRNDSYTPAAHVDITVTTEVDETKTVTVDATCSEDGSVTYYNTDGTVAKVEVLPKLGHDWAVLEYNGDETHTITCTRCGAMDGVPCTWDEGVVTTPATPTEKGLMTYTCTECDGTKTEDIPATGATEVKRETVAPTCEEQGYTLITYSDGSTQKIDFVPALGHVVTGATGDDYIHVEGTHTHKVKCQREGCGIYCMEDCTLETDGVLSGSYYLYSCIKCGEWNEGVISTDKEVYVFGEPILVTVHSSYALSATDWIGLYKEGEEPGAAPNPTSIYWDYAAAPGTAFNILNAANKERPDDFTAGEYTIYLCANDGYEVIASVDITVTTEMDEAMVVRTEPTCTEDGYITYYNTDGTVAKVITAEEDATLKATGHSFGDWTYDGVLVQTHTHTCTASGCGFAEAQRCNFGEGVVTKAPTATEDGIETYTCTVCGGTKTKVLPKTSVTVTGTETRAATCEDAGYLRTFYSDGTYSDEILPALGHAYGEWVFDAETLTHAKTCANDTEKDHVITENCAMETQVSGSEATHTCSACGGSYKTGLIATNKTTYGVSNDPMMVTAYLTAPEAWVGLYRKDDSVGDVPSLYWTYVTGDMVGVSFNLLEEANFNSERNERLTNGEYVLRFFGDGGYKKILCEIDLTVFTDMSNTDFEIKFYKGKVRENGDHMTFKAASVDNPAGGEKVTLCVTADGDPGSSWVGVYKELHNLETDYSLLNYELFYYVADKNGESFSLNWAAKGGFDFEVGDYTIVIFADATYDYPVKYITFSVYRPVVSETVRREATCTTPGLKYVVYEPDGKDETEDEGYVVIPALGHDYGDAICMEDTDTHVRYCAREGCGYAETQACTFVEDKCTVCGGDKHIHNLTKVEGKEATCTEDGSLTHYTCICGKLFLDEHAEEEISAASVKVAAAGHSYGDWIFDEESRTHARTCANNETHVESEACVFDEGVVVTEPEGANDGVKKYTCTICGGSYMETFNNSLETGATRIYGNDRFETMLSAADQLKENLGIEKFTTVVVACGTDFADALSGSYLANQNNAPILLVAKFNVETVKAYIQENLQPGGTVYILGGTNAVPASMETGLSAFTVKRLGGANRFETNLLILKEAGVKSGDDILVATGMNFADCLSASAVDRPILMVAGSALTTSQKSFLEEIRGGSLCVIGGYAAVSKDMEAQLAAYGETERINGANRCETSVAVARKFFPDAGSAVLAYGMNFPDGLCGGALANSLNAPVILVIEGYHNASLEYARECGIDRGFVLGGTGLISDTIAQSFFSQG